MFRGGTSQLTALAHETPALSYSRMHPTPAHRTIPPSTSGRAPPPEPLHAETAEPPQPAQETPSATRRQSSNRKAEAPASRSQRTPPPPPPAPPQRAPRPSGQRSGSDASAGNVLRLGFSGFLDYFGGAHKSSNSDENPYAHVPSHRRRVGHDRDTDDAASGATYNIRSTSPTAVERERRQLRARAAAAAPAGLSLSEQEPYLRRLRYHVRRTSDSTSPCERPPITRAQSFSSRESSIAELPRCLSTDYTALAGDLESTTANPFPAIAGCMVCLSRFQDGEEVIELPCGHLYHMNCIVRWLSRRATCPYCRTALKAPQEKEVKQK